MAFVGAVCLGGCAAPRLDAAGARRFTSSALTDAGVGPVRVATHTEACRVEGATGIRTAAVTSVGDVSLCVSRTQGRALSVRDPGLSEAQFARLDRYRSSTAVDRARPFAAGAAVLLLAGVLIDLGLVRSSKSSGRGLEVALGEEGAHLDAEVGELGDSARLSVDHADHGVDDRSNLA